jgi:hypothetical protein
MTIEILSPGAVATGKLNIIDYNDQINSRLNHFLMFVFITLRRLISKGC